jgi:hypothetical protein
MFAFNFICVTTNSTKIAVSEELVPMLWNIVEAVLMYFARLHVNNLRLANLLH